MNNPIMIPMTIASDQVEYSMRISQSTAALDLKVETAINYVRGRTQERTATPTDDLQEILPQEGFDALSKVIVNPIPSNYGKITWNGQYILVS